jgi:hypothetical protein
MSSVINAIFKSRDRKTTDWRARTSLISQYNNILQQINTTSQDSSFNGIDLLNGDTLKLTSQALSTRQSIAVSALSLANQSQASVLQLLR